MNKERSDRRLLARHAWPAVPPAAQALVPLRVQLWPHFRHRRVNPNRDRRLALRWPLGRPLAHQRSACEAARVQPLLRGRGAHRVKPPRQPVSGSRALPAPKRAITTIDLDLCKKLSRPIGPRPSWYQHGPTDCCGPDRPRAGRTGRGGLGCPDRAVQGTVSTGWMRAAPSAGTVRGS
jgi:hypothetical protein